MKPQSLFPQDPQSSTSRNSSRDAQGRDACIMSGIRVSIAGLRKGVAVGEEVSSGRVLDLGRIEWVGLGEGYGTKP